MKSFGPEDRLEAHSLENRSDFGFFFPISALFRSMPAHLERSRTPSLRGVQQRGADEKTPAKGSRRRNADVRTAYWPISF
jgi:hypothetical protein